MNNKTLKLFRILTFSILAISFFSFIGTCNLRVSTNNRFDEFSKKFDSISNENIKLQNKLNNQLELNLSSKIEANSIQFFLYRDALDKKEITVEELKVKLKKIQEINDRKQQSDKNKDTIIIK